MLPGDFVFLLSFMKEHYLSVFTFFFLPPSMFMSGLCTTNTSALKIMLSFVQIKETQLLEKVKQQHLKSTSPFVLFCFCLETGPRRETGLHVIIPGEEKVLLDDSSRNGQSAMEEKY